MNIIKKENKKPYSTRLKPSVIELIKKQAKHSDVSEAYVIESLAEMYIKVK